MRYLTPMSQLFFVPPRSTRQAILAVVTSATLALTAGAQQELAMGATYEARISLPYTECDLTTPEVSALSAQQAPRAARFTYVMASGDGVVAIVQFLDWNDTTTLFRTFNADEGTVGRKFFCVNRELLQRFARRVEATGFIEGEPVFGILTLPIKLRGKAGSAGFDFTNDAAFGATGGWKVRLSPYSQRSLSLVVGIGLSSIALTKENTNAKVTDAISRPAFTALGGVVLDLDKFQLGVFAGQDRISQPQTTDWAYQGKTWFGLGIGLRIFGSETAKPSTSNK
jgi:hypothetical protein